MTKKRQRSEQLANEAPKPAHKQGKSAIDRLLNVALFMAIIVHIYYRVGLFIPNPVSQWLEGKHTLLWFVAVFAVWLAWNISHGRIVRKKP